MTSPAGRITSVSTCHLTAAGKTVHVSTTRFRNVPSLVQHPTLTVSAPPVGEITTTVAWGGCYYALVRAEQLPVPVLGPSNYRNLVAWAGCIKLALLESGASLVHPTTPGISGLFGVIFIGPPEDPKNHSRNVNVFEDGCVDRCPTGTGLSARAAAMYSVGELQLGEEITVESVIGTEMSVRVVEEVEWQGRRAVVPEVKGEAFVMGESCFYRYEDDPLRAGVNIGFSG